MFLFFRKNVFLKKACFAALVFLAAMLVGCSNGTTDIPVDAQNPTISAQPSGGSWDIDAKATLDLTVTASRPDGGTLGYQWYWNTNDSSSGGIAITDATDTTLSLANTKYLTNGDYYFYVTVKNTIADNGDGGVKAKTTTSDAAKVTVTNGDEYTKVSAVPEGLKGTWTEPYASYTITDTEFSTGTGYGGYGGTIVNIRGKDGSDGADGYITILFTYNDSYPDAAEKYYVISYTDLTSTTMKISGAWNGNDPDFGAGGSGGKATAEEAERAIILENDYFAMHTEVTKQGGGALDPPVPELLQATWSGEDDLESEHTFTITDAALNYSMDSYPFFQAKIVKVNVIDDNTGYLVFQYTSNGLDSDLVDTYCVLYYEGLTESEAKLAIFNNGGGFGDAGEVDQDNAESLYVISNYDYYDPDYDLITCTN